MKTSRIPSEGYGSNCWLICDGDSGEYAIVDPSAPVEIVMAFLQKRGLEYGKMKYVLLTHGHFDHILAADDVRDISHAPLAVHSADAQCLTDSMKNEYKYFFRKELVMRPAEIILKDSDQLYIGNNKIKVMHTPGHTPGSVCFITDDSIYSGDTLFDMSVGRTDLEGGDPAELQNSLRRLAALDGDYTLYPGHGSVSTLEKQRLLNPYLREL